MFSFTESRFRPCSAKQFYLSVYFRSISKNIAELWEIGDPLIMIRIVKPSAISGEVHAPPSKSLTQRAIAAGYCATGTTVIRKPSRCSDALAALDIVTALGARGEDTGDDILIHGNPSFPGHDDAVKRYLNCRESGLSMRMFAPLAALSSFSSVFTGEGSLVKRPAGMIREAFDQLGVSFYSETGYLPFEIRGPLQGRRIEIDGSSGSQLLTGLLMALPLTQNDSTLLARNLKSRPYIDLTLELLEMFGIRVENKDYREFFIPGKQQYTAQTITIEGDWSHAAFFLVAAAIAGSVTVNGLRFESRQADRAILEALRLAGVPVLVKGSSFQVMQSPLKAFQFDATDCPDLFPPLAILAAYAEGSSRIRGISRLWQKESNRAESIRETLSALGIRIDLVQDEMIIRGGKLTAGTISPHKDHRIAMMAAVAALQADGPVTIMDSECIQKSYPEFFDDLASLGAGIIHTESNQIL